MGNIDSGSTKKRKSRVSAKSYMAPIQKVKNVIRKVKKTKVSEKKPKVVKKKTVETFRRFVRKGVSENMPQTNDLEKIGNIAYDLFEMKDCQHGYDVFDWEMAEYLFELEFKNKILEKKKKLNNVEILEQIQVKAEDICKQRGFREGQEVFDWLLAEKIVNFQYIKK